MKTNMNKKTLSLFVVVIMLFTTVLAAGILSGCSGSAAQFEGREDAYYDGAPNDAEYHKTGYNSNVGSEDASALASEKDQGSGIAQAPSVLTEEKLVYTCDMTVETTEYAKTADALKAKVKEFGGIVESESETDNDNSWYYSDHRRYASMKMYLKVRIPSGRYSEFIDSAGSLGKVRQKTQNVQNISRRYSDTEARIKALETEEERLLEMLKKAASVEEMLNVEQRLTEVEYELSSQRSALSGMDVDVAYSTINITLTEVLEYSEPDKPAITFIERIKDAFSGMWEGLGDFGEGLVIVLIYLIPLIVIAGIVLLIIFIVRKARDKKYPERVAARNARKEARRIRKYGKPAVVEKSEQSKE